MRIRLRNKRSPPPATGAPVPTPPGDAANSVSLTFQKGIAMMNAMTNLPLHARRVVSIRPVSATGWTAMTGDRRATHAGAAANYHYITRTRGEDARGVIDFRSRDDLVASGLELPASHPKWAVEEGRIWRELDAATDAMPADVVRAWHVVVSLPAVRDSDDWIDIVRDYADGIAAWGPAVAWAIHARGDGAGGWAIPPHAHLLMTTRVWKHEARHGETVGSWSGPAMRERLHSRWLEKLPLAMRDNAISPYQVGVTTRAHPDCSRLMALFGPRTPTSAPAKISKSRRRRYRIRKGDETSSGLSS
jgi:hypothetical protein